MRLALALLVLAPALGAAIPPGPDPTPVDPYVGLLGQFEKRPLVAFLESHGSATQHRFLRSLVMRPDFGRTVDALVVEFGSARYQVTIDRYVRGERVPLSSLSRVWRRTTQDSGVWNDPIYHDFFRAVRAANAERPASERIRVLLGDPPIDWRQISTRTCSRRPRPSCHEYWLGRRGPHYANVVMTKVLARGQRALLIAGVFHLIRPPPDSCGARPGSSSAAIREASSPSSLTITSVALTGPNWSAVSAPGPGLRSRSHGPLGWAQSSRSLSSTSVSLLAPGARPSRTDWRMRSTAT